ncbi:CrpP-related protein [Agrobacterium vitis]|uniref:CrpP-related protein n=1 Tax=Agrobacterium vitis TaxID=373 RepID=UPI0012E9B1B2|nr:CrpP-related protein [Agrobacterium vitis]MUO85317.1 hypothetical protein [Agrobacterium vitis]
MATEIETVLEWQCRGMNARKVGIPEGANPLLAIRPANSGFCFDQWQVKFEAWLFGWSIENSFTVDDALMAA